MENEIVIQNKKIDLDKLSDKQIVKLYTELREKELSLTEKILITERKIDKLQKSN